MEVTPRRLRPPLDEHANTWRRAHDREATPDRALRKMVSKVEKQYAKAARGEHERIVSRYERRGGDIATKTNGASVESLEVAASCPAISNQDDPIVLDANLELRSGVDFGQVGWLRGACAIARQGMWCGQEID